MGVIVFLKMIPLISNNMFPKNIIQSILFVIILIIISFSVIAFFEFIIVNRADLLLIRDLLSYLLSFIVLGLLAKKKITDFNISNTKYNISLLLILVSLTFTIAIGLPSFYLLSNFFNNTITPIDNSSLIFSLVSIAILPAIFEELIIRGILFDNLIKNNSLIKSIIITTIIFSAIHMSIPKLPMLVLGAVFTCYIYYKTKNILYAMLIHLTTNVVSVFENWLVQPTSDSVGILNMYGNNTLYILIFSFLFLIIGLIYLKLNIEKILISLFENCKINPE
nr:CPBP family intramembrane glutamic endopeptidase [uncultured Flavobacterium sp.]